MEVLWNLLKYEMETPSCNSVCVIVCLSGIDKKKIYRKKNPKNNQKILVIKVKARQNAEHITGFKINFFTYLLVRKNHATHYLKYIQCVYLRSYQLFLTKHSYIH